MNRRIIFIIAVLLAGIVIALMLFGPRNQRYSWSENYHQENSGPYGTSVVQGLFEDAIPAGSFVEMTQKISKRLPYFEDTLSSYIFIGDQIYLDSNDITRLASFVYQGNEAFVVSREYPSDFLTYIGFYDCENLYDSPLHFERDSTAQFVIGGNPRDTFSYHYLKWDETYEYNWSFIFLDDYCFSKNITSLGYQLEKELPSNFASYKFGKGKFYFHTTPLAFSNISLLDSIDLIYVNRVFDNLSGEKIFWDNHSRIFFPDQEFEQIARNRRLNNRGIFKYILSEPALTWAWYLLISMGLLYLIFQSKRKQRIIPIKEPNKNSSLEFLTTISRLYFLQQNHKKIALLQMKLFKTFVRDRYQLWIKDSEQTEQLTLLAKKSDVEEDLIMQIFFMFQNIKNANSISENTLNTFHQSVQRFYQVCK